MTTGRKYTQRSKDRIIPRMIDQRTRIVLNTISEEPKGKALNAYMLFVLGRVRGT